MGQGTHKLYRFKNDYGASVIRAQVMGIWISGRDGDWELAVIRWMGPGNSFESFKLDYSTPVTDDVINGLSLEDVEKLLDDIEKLEKPHAKSTEGETEQPDNRDGEGDECAS